MYIRHLALASIDSHLTTATPPPSTVSANTNAIIQVVTTALIIVMAVIFVTSSLFFCFHRSIINGCCGVDGAEHDPHHGGGEGRRRRALAGLSRAVIETFPTYLYSDVRVHRLGNGELECAVCLNEFKDAEILRLLPTCCHVFHPDCIDTWLISRPTCPVCRAEIGSMSNLTEHGDHLRNILGASSDGDPSVEEQFDQIQIRITTPEAMQITRLQENHPKSHSTGHSPAWTTEEGHHRFTLRLPEEVRKRLATSGHWRQRGGGLALMSSPRSWYRQRSNLGWCRSNRNKLFYQRFNTGSLLDRLGEPAEPSNVVSWFGSPKSDGPVDYSTLVNGRNSLSQLIEGEG